MTHREHLIQVLAVGAAIDHMAIPVYSMINSVKLLQLLDCELNDNLPATWGETEYRGYALSLTALGGGIIQLCAEEMDTPDYQDTAHIAFRVPKPRELANAIVKWNEDRKLCGARVEQVGENEFFVHCPGILGIPIELKQA